MTGSTADGAEIFAPLDRDDMRTVAGYRIRARLGAGGMGKVYLSYTPGGRPVAIKVIRPEFAQDGEFRRRFRSEVQAVQRVQGLYTAPVIDSDTEGPIPWLATAYVPGPPLAGAVAGYGPLPVETVLLLVAGIAEALGVIHGAGVVHRDLKPSNVLLAADGPRVIDFGIARAADATALTGSGVAVGTPAFMAPEQAEGAPVTAATDVFALGQVAVYAATGRPAFGEGTSHGMLYRIVHEDPDLALLPPQLRELTDGCLRKDPTERPTVGEVIGLCRQAADATQLRRVEDWLPSAVAADIAARTTAPFPDSRAPGGYVGGAPEPFADGFAPRADAGATAGLPPTQPLVFGPPPTGPWPSPPPVSGGHTLGPPPTWNGATADSGAHAVQPERENTRGRGRRWVIWSAAAVVAAFLGGAALAVELTGGAGVLSEAGTTPSPSPRAVGGEEAKPGEGAGEEGAAHAGSGAPRSGPPSRLVRPRPVPKSEKYSGLNLPADYHLAFTDRPVQPSDAEDDRQDLSYAGTWNELRTTESNTLVLLDSGQHPTLRTCRAETRFTRQIDIDQLAKGARICLRTGTGDVGLVTFKGASPHSDPSRYVTLDLTLWRNALDVAEDPPSGP